MKTQGDARSRPLQPANILAWSTLTFTPNEPVDTQLRVDVMDPCAERVLVNDANTTTDLTWIEPGCSCLSLRVHLQTLGDFSPELDDWSLSWQAQATDSLYLPLMAR
jgi:hypothetical protein